MSKVAFLGIDTETTGLVPAEDQIISISLRLLNEDLTEVKAATYYALPTKALTEEAAAINGYSEVLWREKGAVTQQALFALIKDFIGDQRNLMCIGHNVKFDIAMLEALYRSV